MTPEVAREVCQRTNSKAMVIGSIAALGSQYVVGLKAVNCNTGDEVAAAQEQAAGKEAVLKALDVAAASMREKLGESLSSVQKYDTPIKEDTTTSLEALKSYSLGMKARREKGESAALPFFKRAIEIDPKFAMAYRVAGEIYESNGEGGRASEYTRKAYDLRDKLSEKERLDIEASYYDAVTGDLLKAAQAYELDQQNYPRVSGPYAALGALYCRLGEWEKAVKPYQEALRLAPANAGSLFNLAAVYLNLNRLDEAEALLKQADELKLESEALVSLRYGLGFLKGDAAEMTRAVSEATGKAGAEDVLLGMQADTAGWYGKLKDARELTERAMESAKHNDAKETAALYRAAEALRDAGAGNPKQAIADANAALKLGAFREVRATVALALAMAGDKAGANRLATEMDKAYPEDTLVQRYCCRRFGGP